MIFDVFGLLGVYPPAKRPLPLPPRNSVGPTGTVNAPVDYTVDTPAITGPLSQFLSVILLIFRSDITLNLHDR